MRTSLLVATLIAGCSPSKDGFTSYNTPPAVAITLPADRSSYDEGETIEFFAQVEDAQDAEEDLQLTWTSDVDGALASDVHADSTGTVSLATSNLSPGNHTITLQAIDSNGDSGEDYISLSVADLDDVPEIAWIHPISGEYGEEGIDFEFKVEASDLQDAAADLEVVLSSSLDGEFCTVELDGAGIGSCLAALSVGEHTLTATVADTDGNTQAASAYFEVIAGTTTDDDEDGWTERQGDCDDTDADVHPNAPEVDNDVDDDCDGLVDEGTPTYDDDADGWTELDGDCDDADASTFPGATEACDGEDDDCDTLVDEGTVCVDDDGDGYTEITGDCDDGSAFVYPGAPEVADSTDNDCDGYVDEGTDAFDDDGDCFCEDPALCNGSIEASCTTLGFEDCDDDDAAAFPGAVELCNVVDDDCDGTVDEADAADALTWYEDGDRDGYGDATSFTVACSAPSGYVSNADDCDDTRTAVRPAATELCDTIDNDCDGTIDESDAADAGDWYADSDGDRYGDASTLLVSCAQPAGYVADARDCDDLDSAVNPAATEICDGVDNDCNGTADGPDATDRTTWYVDGDGDGYGNRAVYTINCTAPSGYVTDSTDCNDTTSLANPGAAEVCDTLDNDCDGSTDEGLTSTYYRDADGDGYGTSTTSTTSCSAPVGYVATAGDCNDTTAAAYPSAAEVCDSIDNDCDSSVDEGVTSTWYRDADGDGYGTTTTSTSSCLAPAGYVATSGDCNDGSSSAYPGRAEVCDSLDNDCDSSVDEGVTTTYYRDADGDGYGTSTSTTTGCSAPTGYVTNSTDCNDSNASLNPGTTWYRDADGDGYGTSTITTASCTQPVGYVSTATDCNDGSSSANPGRTEACDSIDNDCDGSTDEANATGCSTYYYDFDGDSYGSTATSCLCAATGYYRASAGGDCYDYNASAKPGVTSWYTSSRGDGSYDYNCDSSQEQRYTNSGICHVDFFGGTCDRTSGFVYDSSTPSCGSNGDYVTSCTYYGVYCDEVTSTTQQSCR
jgi:hypothetical protein